MRTVRHADSDAAREEYMQMQDKNHAILQAMDTAKPIRARAPAVHSSHRGETLQ